MALTDVFISPAGAGDNSGSSIANALPAISSGDWSTNIEGLDRANKRFVFLEGTYNVTTKLTFTGSAPTDTQPNQWVGAKSDGTILRPKFDETGLRLDLTNYPLFVCSANVQMIDTEENTYYKCLSFENTNSSYSQGSIIEQSTADIDQQMWFGCNFKATPGNANSEVMIANATNYHTCVFEATTKNFDRVLDVRANSRIDNCRIIGGGVGGTVSGDGDGLTTTTQTAQLRDCVITNCHGKGVHMTSTSAKTTINVSNCTIVNNGGDGIDTDQDVAMSSIISPNGEANIIFGNGGVGLRADANDDRQPGFQLLAMGDNSGGNFADMDSYEDMIDVIAVTTADFFDYASLDYRIKRGSTLYKLFGDRNMGAIQNEDFEFASVS